MSSIIGVSLPRLGAIERVTGTQQYAADIRLDNALHVKLVSLACAHARIVGVGTEEALRVPGTRGIFTARDLPQPVPRYGPIYADRPMLAETETKFSGEPVAVVVADTEDAARRAAALVRVDVRGTPGCVVCRDVARPRGAAGAGTGSPHQRFPRAHQYAATVAVRMGQRRRGDRRPRHRERIRVSHGHALCHRAARVSRGLRRERRHDLEPDTASVRVCSASWRLLSNGPSRECGSLRPIPEVASAERGGRR